MRSASSPSCSPTPPGSSRVSTSPWTAATPSAEEGHVRESAVSDSRRFGARRPPAPADMTDLERLLAYEEIRQLAARYALAVDARDLDALVELFVDDVKAAP